MPNLRSQRELPHALLSKRLSTGLVDEPLCAFCGARAETAA